MGKTTTAAKEDADEYFKYVQIRHKIDHMTGMVYIKNPDRADMQLAAEIAGYEQKKAEAEERKAKQDRCLATRGSEFAAREKAFAEESKRLETQWKEARAGYQKEREVLQGRQEAYSQQADETDKALAAISAKNLDIASVKPYVKLEDWNAIRSNLENLIKAKTQTPAKGAQSSSSRQKPVGDDLAALNKEQDTIYKISQGILKIEVGKPYLSDIVAQMKRRLEPALQADRQRIEALKQYTRGSETGEKNCDSDFQKKIASAGVQFAGQKKKFEEERRLLQATIDLEQSLADRYGRLLTSIRQQERMAVAEAFLTEGESDPSQTKHTHVEALLIKKLREATSARVPFDRIPERSTIVFYIDQSPCKNCIKKVLPPFLEELGILHRNIRVRFRFAKYYVKESATDTIDIKWESIAEAQKAYDEFAHGYGFTKTSSGTFPAFKPKVAILPADTKASKLYSDIYKPDASRQSTGVAPEEPSSSSSSSGT